MATFAELNAAKPNDGVDALWRRGLGGDTPGDKTLEHVYGWQAAYMLVRESDKRGLAYAQERSHLVKTQRVFESLGVACVIRHSQGRKGYWTKDGVFHLKPAYR